MAILSKGTDFSTGDQVTAANLDALVDSATFASGAVDNTSTALDSSSPQKIIVKDGGITTVKVADDAITTAKILNNNVTLAKMATQADQTVLGNVSGGTAVPTAVAIVGAAGILVNSDSLGTDDTKGATQGNIKAYVDASSTDGFTPTTMAGSTKSITFPNGLIFKFGTVTGLSSEGETTIDLSSVAGGNFPNACLNASATAINSNGGIGSSNDYWMQVKSISTSEIVYILQGSSSPESSGPGFHWQAYGH
tara:strand:- start:137 stop:889 length:753 start_codon:yes stop_codon:yes gene_type:complete